MTPCLRLITLLLTLTCLSACTQENADTNDQTASESLPPVTRTRAAGLSQDYAEFRTRQVSNIRYDLKLSLSNVSNDFAGFATIEFDLAEGNQSPVTLDFDKGNIHSVSVNGAPAEYDFEQWFISLPANLLEAGSNRIQISYTRPYATDGAGLHRFQDPETDEVYLYTQFEPFAANRVFPLFDQPDLKAPWTLEVIAPAGWQVVSNTRETGVDQQQDERHWHFPETPSISSYLYAVHAGPYTVWESQAGDIPLRLFARNTLAPYVVSDDWFTFTRQSFEFFQNYFDIPYPFGKYDQIIVPDFNAGAMENVAAVTFSERYIRRAEYSVTERRSIASVIAHEMAHMWFGDLVTMKWWNGLWLNESFATYMSYLALAESSEFTNAWDAMYSSMKLWAYDTDQLVTTHPIELEVPTSTNAFTNFDGITYGKGASVLKQLPFLLGEENFRLGVSNYLKEHSWGNTELNDFVSALAEASNRDLSRWQQEWLFESGVNTVQTAFTCTDGNVSSMKLIQRLPDLVTASQVLRTQRTQVALYRYTDEAMVPAATLAVTYDGPVTHVPEAVGLPCPDLVFPNQNDQAFMKVRLDSKSRATLRTRINSIPDATVRLMLWQSLWEEVVDGVTPLTEFTAFAMQALPQENDLVITNLLADYLVEGWNTLSRIDATGFATQRRAIEAFMHTQLQNSVPGSDAQKTWFGFAMAVTHTPQALDSALAWLNGTQSIDGLPIDQDKRWNIVLTLNRYAHASYAELLEAEKAIDNSDIGTNMALAAEAIRPEADTKTQWTTLLTTEPEAYKLATMRTVMARLFPAEQTALLETHRQELIDSIPALVEASDLGYLSEYMEIMPFGSCTQASNTDLDEAVELYRKTNPIVEKELLITRQINSQCLTMRILLGK